MPANEKPYTPIEIARLAEKAMHDTQSRADLLRRNDALLKKLMLAHPQRKAVQKLRDREDAARRRAARRADELGDAD